jgi:nucleolar protein 56
LLGILNNHLLEFLKTHVKPKDTLAVSDTSLYNSMDKVVPCKLKKDSFSMEIVRGIRCHFASYLKAYLSDVGDVDSQNYVFKAQRGLAHSYSRAKVKFNVNKSDNMIIQSISTLDHLDKDINTFAMRVRYASWIFRFLLFLYFFLSYSFFCSFFFLSFILSSCLLFFFLFVCFSCILYFLHSHALVSGIRGIFQN